MRLLNGLKHGGAARSAWGALRRQVVVHGRLQRKGLRQLPRMRLLGGVEPTRCPHSSAGLGLDVIQIGAAFATMAVAPRVWAPAWVSARSRPRIPRGLLASAPSVAWRGVIPVVPTVEDKLIVRTFALIALSLSSHRREAPHAPMIVRHRIAPLSTLVWGFASPLRLAAPTPATFNRAFLLQRQRLERWAKFNALPLRIALQKP
mmetsp:Transcript_52654/g.146694  ORF Transcript_52654/g.146694 Transcript_52654/m.146694 type:complete len:204 (-) Transcript_52654:366-977(-)